MQKRLYRSEANGQVAGVCAGLAEYFNVDVTWIRIAFVIALLAGGPGAVIYIALWLVVPEEGDLDKSKNDEFEV